MTAFMAGEKRVLVTGAVGLGFHQVNSDFGVDHYTRRTQHRTGYMFKKRGVKKWFLKKMYQSRPNVMWYPTRDESLDTGVTARFVDANGNTRDRDGSIVARDGATRPTRFTQP